MDKKKFKRATKKFDKRMEKEKRKKAKEFLGALFATPKLAKKKIKTKSKKYPRFAINCIKIWNMYYLTRKHSADSKVVGRLNDILKDLRSGYFSTYSFKESMTEQIPEFFKKKKVKFTKKEIENSIKEMVLFYRVDYLPQNKKLVPRNIDQMFYNPQTGYSYFLIAHYKGANKIDFNKFKEQYPEIRKQFEKARKIVLDEDHRKNLNYCLNELKTFYTNRIINKDVRYNVEKSFGSFEIMCKTLINFINQQKKSKEYKDFVWQFQPRGSTFMDFIRYYETTLKVKLVKPVESIKN